MIARCIIFLASLAVLTRAAPACTIPVFRFALDRWEADSFHLVLPPAVADRPEVRDLLRPLRANGKANLDITTARDASLAVPELRHSRESDQTLWSGDLTGGTLASVLESPARKQFIERVLAGDSMVWFLAHDGSPAEIARLEQIEKRLRFLEQVAALPVQDPNDPDSQLGPGPPLRLKFTALRVRRDDPAEALLLRMLAGPRHEIDPAKTSFASVAFAKGRVLGAWALDAFDDTLLEDACMFLVGRCSCRMKNENPGWDILLNVDWAAELARATNAAPEAATSSTVAASAKSPVIEETKTEPAAPLASTAPAKGLTWTAVAMVAAGVVGLLAVMMLVSGRRRQ